MSEIYLKVSWLIFVREKTSLRERYVHARHLARNLSSLVTTKENCDQNYFDYYSYYIWKLLCLKSDV